MDQSWENRKAFPAVVYGTQNTPSSMLVDPTTPPNEYFPQYNGVSLDFSRGREVRERRT